MLHGMRWLVVIRSFHDGLGLIIDLGSRWKHVTQMFYFERPPFVDICSL